MASKTRAYSVSGISSDTAAKVAKVLQERLNTYNDLHLTLKHAHWNVVGPSFIGVHEMIDPEVDAVRLNADAVAERIATLGFTPNGTIGAILKTRAWADYPVGKGLVPEHLAALDAQYDRVIGKNREAIEAVSEDPITEDLLIGQTAALEKFQWFVRAHLENGTGRS